MSGCGVFGGGDGYQLQGGRHGGDGRGGNRVGNGGRRLFGEHGSGSGGGGCFRSEVLRGPLGEATLPDVLAWKKRHGS